MVVNICVFKMDHIALLPLILLVKIAFHIEAHNFRPFHGPVVLLAEALFT